MILNTAEEQYATLKELELANVKLQSENAALQEASLNVHTSDATSSYDDLKERLYKAESRLGAEHTRAEEAVAREASLRAEMAYAIPAKLPGQQLFVRFRRLRSAIQNELEYPCRIQPTQMDGLRKL